jgi:CheY-like chemotaxis protein
VFKVIIFAERPKKPDQILRFMLGQSLISMATIQHNVCLIDDDKIYQFTARKILESTGLAKTILSFYNGSEAIGYFREKSIKEQDQLPDVIFLDINMPVMNGWQFLEEYHKLLVNLKKSITIYVVSSSVDDCDIQRSKQFSSVTDYIVKPINRIKYQQLIEQLGTYSN